MPKKESKREAEEANEPGDSSEVEPTSSGATAVKKQKTGTDVEPESQRNEDGEPYFSLGPKRRVTLRKWKTGKLIDIREYWQDAKDGKDKPGKKGLLLTSNLVA
jgi:hypothetical protein